ncbi:protein rep [Romboutsia lituseburensis]|uniref:protein rep n=1 Tax=Romboutsia lituseburensis TaxID=1537 RepID=UPI00215A1B6B|nr:protein rep [Romboutsia lituseburensis]MCR8747281.1 protein rep [Romboutsia lituseburensis]
MQDIKLEEKYSDKKKKNLNLISFIDKHISNTSRFAINECGSYLEFLGDRDLNNKKLLKSNFCKNRFCPMCSWRKTKKDTMQLSILMEYLKKEFGYEFIFLTLTAPNVPGEKLNDEIKDFNESFLRLAKRKEFVKINKGYVRKLEITYNKKENTYHPHFHVIIAVNKSYFKNKDYLSKKKFLELWKECKRDNAINQVDVRKIDVSDKKSISEIAKYGAKDSDYTVSQEVFDMFYKALKSKKLITYNGIFKEILELYKQGDLDYLKEIDTNYYEFLISHTWNFDKNEYNLFAFKELSEEYKIKYNKKLIEEFDID